MAFLLYAITATALSTVWSRKIQRISVGTALVLVAMPLLFTGRAILTGRTYAPSDIAFMAEPLSDYARDYGVEKPHNIFLSDLHCQILPWHRAVRYSLANGEWPLWNPFILGGDILAAAAQPAVYDPWMWLGMLLPLPDAFTFGATLTFFLAGFFTFAFARASGLHDIAAYTAAAGFMFCGMLAFFVGWPLGRAWVYLPLVLFATHERRWRLLTVAFVLLIVAGHPESVLHVVAVGAVYGVVTIGFRRRASGTSRLGDTDSRFSLPVSETFRAGESSQKPEARGQSRATALLARLPTPAAEPEARSHLIAKALLAGITALALTAIYLLPFAEAVPQTLESFIRTEMYATQTYQYLAPPEVQVERIKKTFVPGYRGPDPLSARVGLVVLALAIGGALRWRKTGFFTLLAIVCLLATFGTWPVAHALHALPLFDIAINERLAFAASFALAMLAAFAVDAIAARRHVIAIAIVALLLVERTIEDGGIYPALPRDAFFPRVPLIEAIPRDARMTAAGFSFTANNPAMYALEDVRGYQAMTFRRLHDTYALWSVYQRAWFNRVDDLARPFLSFLNVRYAIARGDAPEGWRVLSEDRGTKLLENTRELPRVFLPRHVRYRRDPKVVLAEMQQATDFFDVAWMEAPEYEPHEIVNGRGHLTLRRTGLGYDFDATMEQAGWVVVSATRWKGWRAYIDDRRVETRFANHAFLGVYIPRGQHRVTLKYLPESFVTGRAISLGTLLLIGIVFLVRRAGGVAGGGQAILPVRLFRALEQRRTDRIARPPLPPVRVD